MRNSNNFRSRGEDAQETIGSFSVSRELRNGSGISVFSERISREILPGVSEDFYRADDERNAERLPCGK